MIAAEWSRFAREFPALAERLVPDEAASTKRSAVREMTASIAAGFLSEDGQVLPVRSVDRTRENVIPPSASPTPAMATSSCAWADSRAERHGRETR